MSDVSKPPRSFIIIPARLHSTRLPRKLLLRETGRTLIQHTYESAMKATRPRGVCVAADHEEIEREVLGFGGQVRMTNPEATCGTDRVAELAAQMDDVDIFVNVQGDEPEISGEAIDRVVELLELRPDGLMSTLSAPIRSREKLEDPSCVKVVVNQRDEALYFSRSPIPHAREWSDSLLHVDPPRFRQHLGIYAYRRQFLLDLARSSPTDLEKTESLEQLRVLDQGHRILVGLVDEQTLGIDTIEDYRAFVMRQGNC